MEDSANKLHEGLSVHRESLRVALEDLGPYPESQASVRRIARSLANHAAAFGADKIAGVAKAVQEADDDGLLEATLRLLDLLRRTQPPPTLAERHLLVVEDNPTIAAALNAYLQQPGYVVHLVATAAQAELTLTSQPIHLVLLDLILPDRDGRELLVQMRERVSTASLPVVVLSAQTGAVARSECLALGANEFIEKPANPNTVREAVARQLAAARSLQEAQRDPLTHLPNRAGMAEAFDQARHQPGCLTVALLDLDGLKAVNDTLGHEAGDRFILAVTQEVGEGLTRRHTLVRLGGDEFALIAPDTDPDEARGLLVEALARLEARRDAEITEAGLNVSFCAGIAPVGPDTDLRTALAEADKALYWAKSRGSGTLATTEYLESLPKETLLPRVLLLEDDRVTAALVEHRLSRDGFEVTHFTDGGEALTAAEEGRFDLAVLDVKVPGLDGFALLERLRGLPHFRTTPVLMLTSMGSEGDVVRGLSSGANDYMLKPFSPNELVARVRRLVPPRTSRAGPPSAS